MKLLCFVVLSICALAHGASLQNEIPLTGVSVTKTLNRSQYDLNIVSNTEEVQAQLPIESGANIPLDTRRIISGAIEEVLEEVRDLIIHGNENIPPLDPFVLDIAGPYRYNVAPGVRAEGTIHNLRMEGLRWFVAERININPLRMTVALSVTLPWFSLTGSYDTHARLMMLNHRAGGNFRIFAHRIEVDFDMRMGTNIFGGGHLILRELDIKIDIHDTQISITGMTGSTLLNSLISSTIQGVSQELIQSQMENVSRLLSEELFDAINDVLRNFTVSDIFG